MNMKSEKSGNLVTLGSQENHSKKSYNLEDVQAFALELCKFEAQHYKTEQEAETVSISSLNVLQAKKSLLSLKKEEVETSDSEEGATISSFPSLQSKTNKRGQ